MRDSETVMSGELQFSYSNSGIANVGKRPCAASISIVVAGDPIVGQGKKAVKRKVLLQATCFREQEGVPVFVSSAFARVGHEDDIPSPTAHALMLGVAHLRTIAESVSKFIGTLRFFIIERNPIDFK